MSNKKREISVLPQSRFDEYNYSDSFEDNRIRLVDTFRFDQSFSFTKGTTQKAAQSLACK